MRPWGCDSAEEELAPIGVGSCISHRENACNVDAHISSSPRITPQAPYVTLGRWHDLEGHVRRLLSEYSQLLTYRVARCPASATEPLDEWDPDAGWTFSRQEARCQAYKGLAKHLCLDLPAVPTWRAASLDEKRLPKEAVDRQSSWWQSSWWSDLLGEWLGRS